MKLKKLFIILILLALIAGVAACDINDNEDDPSVPEYLSMTVSDALPAPAQAAATKTAGTTKTAAAAKAENSPINIIPVANDTLIDADGAYTALLNQNFYIFVNLNNPENFEILSFTLNGEKYQSYQFEYGSTGSMLILKKNAGQTAGLIEYTIDAIKYIDNQATKNVKIKGEQTIKVSVLNYSTVHFDSKGGSAVSAIMVADGQKAAAPDAPSRVGYIFDAWYTSGTEFTELTKWSFDTVVTADITLYAKWIERTGKNVIVFNGSGATGGSMSSQEIEPDDSQALILNKFEKTGYTFAGWALNPGGPVAYSDGADYTMGTSSVNLYAVWTAVKYAIRYENVLDGTNPNTVTEYTIESETITFTAPTRTGYTGVWDILSIPKGSVGDKTVTANWTTVKYAIRYENVLNGTNPNTVTEYTIESETITFTAPTRTGYTGVWDTLSIPKGSVGDKTVTANWTTVKYSIRYENVLDGTNPNTVTEYTIESETITFTAPTRTGYTGAWDTTSISKGSTGDKTITAVWTELGKSTVTYDYRGGSGTKISDVITAETSFSLHVPEQNREHCLFGGWYVSIAPNNPGVKIAGADGKGLSQWVYSSMTVYAYWLGYDDLNYTQNATGYTVSKGTATLREICIPGTYNGVTITSIGSFEDFAALNKITIPNSVTSIGSRAFRGCTGLTQITIPDSVQSIGDSAFSTCGISTITIPYGVQTVASYTFFDCKNLTGIVLPATLKSIGDNSFQESGIKSIEIPYGVTTIGEYAFDNCKQLKDVTFPDSLLTVGHVAFQRCSALTEVTIPDSVTRIESYAFNVTGLKTVHLGSGLTYIGDRAFANCSITSIIIPRSVTSIGGYAFSECTKLTAVYIERPSAVFITTLGAYAFKSCTNLTDIYVADSASVSAYTAASDWADYADKIKVKP